MSMKSLQMGFVGLVLSVATAWAGPSAIQGVVKDAKGQAIKGADVQIQVARWQKAVQNRKDGWERTLCFRWPVSRYLSRHAGRQWRGQGIDYEHANQGGSARSEERRGGKECR